MLPHRRDESAKEALGRGVLHEMVSEDARGFLGVDRAEEAAPEMPQHQVERGRLADEAAAAAPIHEIRVHVDCTESARLSGDEPGALNGKPGDADLRQSRRQVW